MKICMLCRIFYLGGVSTHLIDLSEQLIKKGHDVYILTAGLQYENSKPNKKLFKQLIDLGVKCIRIDFPKNSNKKFNYMYKMLNSVNQCRKVFKDERFDIIHVHTPVLSFIPKILGYKFVRTFHLNSMNMSIFDIRADYEIAISTEVYNFVKKKYNYQDSELHLIFNGISSRFYINRDKPYRKEIIKYGLPIEKIYIGLVGSIDERKGQDLLIKAISEIEEKVLSKIHVIFLGDGEVGYINSLKEHISFLKLEEIFSFIPFQDPKEIYEILDIHVLPSRLEGFGLVVIEAMLSGCCVVRSNTEGALDQIKNDITGYIFKNEDINELSKLLSVLVNESDKRIKIAKSGQEHALHNFTSEVMTEKTLKVYELLK